MPYSYLKALDLPGEVEQTIQSLGARTPSSLLSMIEHSWDSFVRVLGQEQTKRLHDGLVRLVPAEERERLKSLPEFQPKLGAWRVSQPDSQTAAARQERDQLMQHIKLLRESQDESLEKQQLLSTLEQRLRDLLKSTVAVK